jgi:pilus assembly protein CpaC
MRMIRMRETTRRPELFGLGLAAFLLVGGVMGIEAAPQAAPAAGPATQQQKPQPEPVQPPQQVTLPQRASEAPQNLHLMVGRSLVITSPVRIKRVSLADPKIADALVVTPFQILINGKEPGGVSLLLWDESDQNQAFDIYVDLDILALTQKIREVFPNEPVQLEASKDVVMLSGKVSSKAVADQVYKIVSSATPKVVSLMEAPAPPSAGEILLEVKFAEVDRTALSQLGANLFSTGAASTVGTITTGQFGSLGAQQIKDAFGVRADPFPNIPSPTTGPSQETFQVTQTLSDVLNIFLFRPDIHMGVVIKALQQKNVLQILAEPNLLTETGKEASFLSGGEFPFPVVQGGAAGAVPTVTILFKEFGVRLNFRPDLMEDGRIHLKVKPEVSALDFTNALTLSGFVIPALSTRRVESEMILEDGQSFAIAGLVDNRLTETISKVPGLGDIPLLGYLFKSRSLNRSKSELLVVVTPHVVRPIGAAEKLPALQFPKPFLPLTPPLAPKTPGPK